MSYARNKRKKERKRRNNIVEEFKRNKMDKEQKVIINYINRYIEIKKISKMTLVHGAFTYECEECGKTWKMWLEVGVEGKDSAMPCPFIIRCKCGGMAKHISWQDDVKLPEPRPLGKNMSYFKLDEKGLKRHDENACGIPVLR